MYIFNRLILWRNSSDNMKTIFSVNVTIYWHTLASVVTLEGKENILGEALIAQTDT